MSDGCVASLEVLCGLARLVTGLSEGICEFLIF